MLGKLALLLQSKALVAAVSAAVVVGGGSTALVATGQSANLSALLTATTSVDSTPTPEPLAVTTSASPTPSVVVTTTATATTIPATADGAKGQPVDELVGTLLAYDAGQRTLTLQVRDGATVSTVSVSDATVVDGLHAKALSDLSAAVGSQVTVHADVQANGSLLAMHVSVTGDNEQGKPDTERQDPPQQEQQSGQTQEVSGTIERVDAGAATFTVSTAQGATTTVVVTDATEFEGSVSSIAVLRPTMVVSVKGTVGANGTLTASKVSAKPSEQGTPAEQDENTTASPSATATATHADDN